MPFVCLVLSPAVALILFASRDTHLLLQFVHCTGDTFFSLPPVLLGHGVLQILLQLQAQLNEETNGIKSEGKLTPQNPKPCIHSIAFAPRGGWRT